MLSGSAQWSSIETLLYAAEGALGLLQFWLTTVRTRLQRGLVLL